MAGFLVDDVVAATEELRRAGIAILSGPFTSRAVLRGFTFAARTGTCMALLKATISNPPSRDGRLDLPVRELRERLVNAGAVVRPDGRSRELFPVAIGVNEGLRCVGG